MSLKYKSIPLWGYIVAAVVPILVFIAIVLAGVFTNLNYKDYKLAFADSITYSQEYDCLRADYNGVSTKLSHHNSAALYRIVVGSGFGSYEHTLPDSEVLLLDFGNGDIMNIWYRDSTSLTVQYIPFEGEEYLYSTLVISRFICLERLVSVEWANELWK